MPDTYLKDTLSLTFASLPLSSFDHSFYPLYLCPSSLPQIKELQLVLAEAHDSLRGLQEQLSQERQLRKEEADTFNQKMVQVRGAQCPPYTYSNLSSLNKGPGIFRRQEQQEKPESSCPVLRLWLWGVTAHEIMHYCSRQAGGILSLSLTACVTSGQSHFLFGPQFPICEILPPPELKNM